MKKNTIKNKVPTFRVEILSFAAPGLSENTRWELHSIQNDLGKVRELMQQNHFFRAFKCTPAGRILIASNMEEANDRGKMMN